MTRGAGQASAEDDIGRIADLLAAQARATSRTLLAAERSGRGRRRGRFDRCCSARVLDPPQADDLIFAVAAPATARADLRARPIPGARLDASPIARAAPSRGDGPIATCRASSALHRSAAVLAVDAAGCGTRPAEHRRPAARDRSTTSSSSARIRVAVYLRVGRQRPSGRSPPARDRRLPADWAPARSASTSSSPRSTPIYLYTVPRLRMTQEFNRIVPAAAGAGPAPARRPPPEAGTRGLSADVAGELPVVKVDQVNELDQRSSTGSTSPATGTGCSSQRGDHRLRPRSRCDWITSLPGAESLRDCYQCGKCVPVCPVDACRATTGRASCTPRSCAATTCSTTPTCGCARPAPTAFGSARRRST